MYVHIDVRTYVSGMESSLLGGQIREFEQALGVKPLLLKEVLPAPTALPDHTQSTVCRVVASICTYT